MRSDYGYDNQLPESLPKVMLGDTLIYEIELVSFENNPIPRYPTEEELESSRRAREEEAKEHLRQHPPIPYGERCKMALQEKDKGNEYFRQENWKGEMIRVGEVFFFSSHARAPIDRFLTRQEFSNARRSKEMLR